MSVTCGTCTVEQKTWAIIQGETTPSGKPKKKKIIVRVPKEFDGTEEQAEAAGWVMGEFGYQCPLCVIAEAEAMADVEDDPTPGDNESATIHHALNQLTSTAVSESERVNRQQYGVVAEELIRLLASGLNFTVWEYSEDSYRASTDDFTGEGSTSLNALNDLAGKVFPRVVTSTDEDLVRDARVLHKLGVPEAAIESGLKTQWRESETE